MKNLFRIMAGILAFILIGGILFIANGLVGNPVSKFIASKNAVKYIEETYPNMDLEVPKATYNFKSGGYSAYVKSPTSIDTHFVVEFSPTGQFKYDSYENSVPGKWNTLRRVDDEYRRMVGEVFEAEDFPYTSNIDYGSLITKGQSNQSFGPAYGLSQKDLELDKIYDIKELAKSSGQIVLYIEDGIINATRASEVLLDIKKIFDQKDVPFYAIDFTLEEYRTEENRGNRVSFQVASFLYSDIYQENLIERLEEAAADLTAYYEKEDEKMKK